MNPFNCFARTRDDGFDETENFENYFRSDSEDSDDEVLPRVPQYSQPVATSSLSGAEKLAELRILMKERKIAVYLVPSEDEHQLEYTAESDKRREYLCGFSGSAGICVVTIDNGNTLEGEAVLSTDGRYFLQAEKELDPKLWRLLKQRTVGHPSWQEFAMKKATESSISNIISCDARLLNLQTGQFFALAQSIRGFHFKPLASENLVDEVWGPERPPRSLDPVYELAQKYAGETSESKLKRVRQSLDDKLATHLIVTSLDDIGWLLNLRADVDIPFSPFFFAYVVITQSRTVLYCNPKKLANVQTCLASISGFENKPYEDFYTDLSALKTTKHKEVKLMLPSKSSCNYALIDSIHVSIMRKTILFESIISVMKLTKNKTELFNARVAQTKDSLVFILLALWLENSLKKGKKITEYEVSRKIYLIRKRFTNFKGLSYETIASTGANAAVIHYVPKEIESSVIDIDTPFLLDSGAHYLEGTTDITRTYKFGTSGPMHSYRKYYSLVLKGHLSVALAKFPEGGTNTGTILDSYARQPLWNEGLDFNHGTGHGIGSFGNVHEGPLYILTTSGGTNFQDYFKKGAILTDEPGYYVDGEFGFRIESEIEIIGIKALGRTRDGNKYLGFEYLTKVPFCRNLIDLTFLTRAERVWINDYHKGIREELGPELLRMGERDAYLWLMREAKPLV